VQRIEISLRIPAVKDPLKDGSGSPINNSDVRFMKQIESEHLPKPGELVDLSVRPDGAFQATVVRSDWHEAKALFVVSCKYAKTSIPRSEYLALMNDHEWAMKSLLA
jgi:hypothetical protein